MWDCHGDKYSATPACGKGAPLSLNLLTLMTHGKVPQAVYGLAFLYCKVSLSYFPRLSRVRVTMLMLNTGQGSTGLVKAYVHIYHLNSQRKRVTVHIVRKSPF